MKYVILCVLVYLLSVYPPSGATANSGNSLNITEARLNEHMLRLYEEIDFGPGKEVSREVFGKAYRGFVNLKNAGRLSSETNILSICDFSRSSTDYRLWIIDLDRKKILYHTYVAHGQKSGEEFATSFSNQLNSHQSSLGFYVTGETYDGKHGLSMRLHGMDNGYNSAALDRGIVVHGAEYVCNNFVNEHNRLGRSWGCPAVDATLSAEIIETIKDSTCLFIYYPDKKYLASSFWLNKKPESLPDYQPFRMQPIAAAVIRQPESEKVYITRDSFQKQQQTLPVSERAVRIQ